MNRPFGNYILHDRIGIGGMGEVFRATKRGPEGFEVEVALKLILPHLAREASFRDRFVREAKLAASLKHPNIVHVNGFDIINDTPVIEMEYVPGADLRRILRTAPPKEKFPLPESVVVLYAVARGLDHAHRFRKSTEDQGGIIHCDLNPHNILISNLGEVKVTDFGIARAVLGDVSASATVRGKLAYMSPEQMEGRKFDRRTDLFSFGIIAYQLLSGTHPFERESEGATITAIGKVEHLPLRDADPDLPEPLYELVERLLSLDPDQRPASANMVLQILQPLVRPTAVTSLAEKVRSLEHDTPKGEGIRPVDSVTAPTVPRTRISRSWPYLVVAAAALAMISGAFLLPTGLESSRDRLTQGTTRQPPPVNDPAAETQSVPSMRTVTVQSRPAGAHILLNGIPEGRAPVVIKSDPDGRMPALEARLYGYRDDSFRIPPNAEEQFVITLAPLPTGNVRISAKPWARVGFRGEDLGYTPVEKEIPVGGHIFVLTYDPLDVEREIVVDVTEAGETVSVDMRESP